MKLRNKKTGKIGELNYHDGFLQVVDTDSPLCGNSVMGEYTTFSAINDDWEDYEEPKEYWFISTGGEPHRFEGEDKIYTPNRKSIGNYFETKEEAEKAIEKLKAWKRLKDKGFKFDGYHIPAGEIHFNMSIQREAMDEFIKDMGICFGGEE